MTSVNSAAERMRETLTYGLVGGETLIVFDNVFVPWERVFMCGEHEFAGLLVERFATLHRQNYGGCKGGVSDIIIGATALAAEMQGSSRSVACQGQTGRNDAPYRNDVCRVDLLLGNGAERHRAEHSIPIRSWQTVRSKM